MQNYFSPFKSCCYIFILSLLFHQSGCQSQNENFTSYEYELPGNQLETATGSQLQKCKCGANLFWHQNQCHEANTTVNVVEFYPEYKIQKVPTSHFPDVVMSKVSCHEGEIPVDIMDGLISGDRLFHQFSGDRFQNFCVENIQDENGTIVMVSTICLPNHMTLGFCCSECGGDDVPTCEYDQRPSILPTITFGRETLTSLEIKFFNMSIPKDLSIDKIDLNPNQTLYSLDYRNGEIMLIQWASMSHYPKMIFPPTQYCLVLEDSNIPTFSAHIWEDMFYPDIYEQFPEISETRDEKCEGTMHWVLLPLVIISTVFLVAILVLHAILPNLRKSVGSKITVCHMVSLLAGFFLLIALHIPQNHRCKIYGPLIQFSFLATFFWLNIMCFDIWWKLRCHCPAGETPQSSKRRFLLYSIYAWGCPFFISILTIVMDNIPALQDKGLILPGFAEGGHCWFADRKAVYVYYFGIIAALMALNLFFFVWVLVILVNANCTYNEVLRNNSTDNKRVWIYLKIFCLMGVTWICEFFSWQEGTCKIWIATDIINALRGLILFIIFFANRKSANKIWERVSTINATLNTRLSRSMNTLRKLSIISSMTVESAIDSRRTSEVINQAELPNKFSNNHHAKDSSSHDPKRKRNASSPVIVDVERAKDSTGSSETKAKQTPSCPSLISCAKRDEEQIKEKSSHEQEQG